jgi:VIT1/CCC1 family predicted Fe2+/Mn2+ transporter
VLRGLRAAGPEAARAIVLGALPEGVAAVADEAEVGRLVARAQALPAPPRGAGVTLEDLRGALGSCLLVILATLPPTVPFLLVDDVQRALRWSNAAAVVSLFFAGWALGRATAVRAWLLGLAMVLLGVSLVALTIALGG